MDYLYPKNFARFYDTIYHSMRDDVDSSYFLGEIASTGGKVLEIGVGTGRLFTRALQQGADIYGIDISEEMLAVLLSKLPEAQHHRISRQSITDFSYDTKFDLIIAPFRVIMHLLNKEDQIKAINNVYKHLNKNGRFIFDVFVPDLNQLINGIDNYMDFEGEYKPGRSIKRFVTTVPDLINQRINITFHMEWDEDNTTKHDYWQLYLRFFFRYELEHLVERTAFESYHIYGDYNGGELKKGSREFLVVCRRS